MNNVKNLTNLNSLFKEIYADKILDLLCYSDFHWEKNKYYYDPQVLIQNPFLKMINPNAPYTEKVDKKTLILEIE